MGRGNFRITLESEFSVTEIVGQQNHNIRRAPALRRSGCRDGAEKLAAVEHAVYKESAYSFYRRVLEKRIASQ